MSKFIFIKEPDELLEQPLTRVVHEVNTVSISEVFIAFEMFLLGAGYSQETIDRLFL